MSRNLKELPRACPRCGLTTGSFELRAYKSGTISWRIDHTVPATKKRRHCGFSSLEWLYKKNFKTIRSVIKREWDFQLRIVHSKPVYVKIKPTKKLLDYITKKSWEPVNDLNPRYNEKKNREIQKQLLNSKDSSFITEDMKIFWNILDKGFV